MESLSLEYSYLLEAQRLYFQEQLRQLEREKTLKIAQLEEEYAHLLCLKEDHEKKVRDLEDERRKWEKRASALEKKMADTLKETQFLQQVL